VTRKAAPTATQRCAPAVQSEITVRNVSAHARFALRGHTPTVSLGPAPTTGDPVLIERLLDNLVANAVPRREPRQKAWRTTPSASPVCARPREAAPALVAAGGVVDAVLGGIIA
jgi:hypothetical protein